MGKYYCDRAADNQIDNYFNSKGFVMIDDNPDWLPGQAEIHNALIFVHTAYLEDWKLFSSRYTTAHVIFMSRAIPATLPNEPIPANIHQLGYKADELEQEPRLNEFLSAWDRGESRWDLLMPEPYPEYLVAYYFAIVAGIDQTEIIDDLKVKAQKDFEFLNKVHNESLTFDRDGINNLFCKMVKM